MRIENEIYRGLEKDIFDSYSKLTFYFYSYDSPNEYDSTARVEREIIKYIKRDNSFSVTTK